MKIGIDIDGVILDSEREFRVQSELYDIRKLKKNSIIDNKELKVQMRYNWSEEELNDFINKKFIEVAQNSNFMPGAIEVINLLKKEGHELIIITARGAIIEKMKRNGPVTEQMRKDVMENVYHNSLVNWIQSFR